MAHYPSFKSRLSPASDKPLFICRRVYNPLGFLLHTPAERRKAPTIPHLNLGFLLQAINRASLAGGGISPSAPPPYTPAEPGLWPTIPHLNLGFLLQAINRASLAGGGITPSAPPPHTPAERRKAPFCSHNLFLSPPSIPFLWSGTSAGTSRRSSAGGAGHRWFTTSVPGSNAQNVATRSRFSATGAGKSGKRSSHAFVRIHWAYCSRSSLISSGVKSFFLFR